MKIIMNKIRSYVVAMSMLALFVAGCGKKAEETATDEKPASGAAATPVDPGTVGTITGKIIFSGAKPAAKPIKMDAEPICKQAHSGTVNSEEVVVNDNGTLQNVFVYVKSGAEKFAFDPPKEPVALDQHGCMYVPHVIGVQVNQEIKILNSDNTNHNIHPLPKQNREWNQSMAPKQEPLVRSFPREEVLIAVKCNVHPWMKSYIGVLKHPLFAVSGKDGTFEIKGVPPGEYEVEAWHEKYGQMSAKVQLGPKDSKAMDFTFKSDAAATSRDDSGAVVRRLLPSSIFSPR